ncbi:MAG: hypothetical protein KDD69_16525 [Bdellovibrionales bacterium]|nr:hypothetical protein [Bdellovibrionales bacterium]
MAKSKKDSEKSTNYITTIREGAIGANIFRGVTPDGHAYLYFSLSRSWKSANGSREGYSDRFYERNADALQAVVAKACDWISKNPEAADAEPEGEQIAAAA